MKPFLMIDIGAGTMDVMCYVPSEGMHYKAVVQSPVRTLARRIASTTGNLVVTGVEMGGGPVTAALQARTRSARVLISRSAAATVHHDPARVAAMGFELVEDSQARSAMRPDEATPLELKDLEIKRIRQIVEGFGIDFEFEAVALCAQDHGVAPPGVSHLDFRHQWVKAQLDRTPHAHALLYEARDIPEAFNRLRAIADTAAQLPAQAVYLMDSGMAAIVGASMDPSLAGKGIFSVLDVATSHTVGAVVRQDELLGSFEYHTSDITRGRLEQLIRDLPEGHLDHDQILSEGGHGAYLRHAPGFDSIEAVVATGPKRGLLAGTHLPVTWGAPWGDNMMTGCVGLLESMRRHRGMGPIAFV
jgi:uncharacterized protein (DUF1786 family)